MRSRNLLILLFSVLLVTFGFYMIKHRNNNNHIRILHNNIISHQNTIIHHRNVDIIEMKKMTENMFDDKINNEKKLMKQFSQNREEMKIK